MGLLQKVIQWFLSSDRKFGATWPRLHIVTKLIIMVILTRVVFLMAGVLYVTFFSSVETQADDDYYPANNLSSVFTMDHNLYDITDGSLTTLNELLEGTDIGIVMLYAPWCAHSISAAVNFANVSKTFSHLNNTIRFFGINCWTISGSCRRREGVFVYPRIFIHHSNVKRIEYFGDKSQIGLESFIVKVIYPMVYVTSLVQFNQLLVKEENIIIGYFDFTQLNAPGFNTYFLASLLATQTDSKTGFTATPRYAVVSDSTLSLSLSLSRFPSIRYISLRGREHDEIYDGVMFPDEIYNWSVNKSLKKLVQILVPTDAVNYLIDTGPVLILFTPFYIDSPVLSNFNQFAVFYSSLNSSNFCKSLRHLLPWECIAPPILDELYSLPLCSSHPNYYCPVFNPLFPRGLHHRSSLSYCQDGIQMGGAYGGWPPPCHMISLKFYIIDSLRYWGLAESMGVTSGWGQSLAIVADYKSNNVFHLPITNNTAINDYMDMIISIVTGRGSPIIRNERGQGNCTKLSNFSACVYEITAATFPHLLASSTNNVLIIFHYATWCAACANVWPHLLSLSLYNSSILKLARINGEDNDLPLCHAPTYYPSIALYPRGRKHFPVWYPRNKLINIHRILDFISIEANVLLVSEGAGQSYNEWTDMGWLLWETAEKERKALEQKNNELEKEIYLLQHEIEQLKKE